MGRRCPNPWRGTLQALKHRGGLADRKGADPNVGTLKCCPQELGTVPSCSAGSQRIAFSRRQAHLVACASISAAPIRGLRGCSEGAWEETKSKDEEAPPLYRACRDAGCFACHGADASRVR